ncbi:MAG: DUF1573 domain-containing protein [Candidatus Amulumruptor caecigallinarius]|nr:DUF1573 domain-containing protein [Candidatus Amulumruptor caecigallinarius]MCM1397542.1 DUF1573 domain-containing protein [Candidatus Amulumruptor caecigallinarius]MCM1454444.1 DUF1573 domain-containing protein [bacterium]
MGRTALTALVALLLLPGAILAEVKGEWVETTHDFGVIAEADGPVRTRFALVNTGTEPLTIINARATCGCTRPEFDTKAVAHGDTAWLAVSYDPAGRPGRFDKKIYVDTDMEPRRTTLHVVGSVVATPATVARKYPVEAGPLRLKQAMLPFGELKRHEVKSTYIEAYNISTDSVTPVIEGLPEYIHIMVSPKTVPPGEQMVISTTFYGRESPLWGYVDGTAKLIPAKGGDWPAVELPWMATVTEDFSLLTDKQRAEAPVVKVTPEILDFTPAAPGGSPAEVTLTISNSGKNPLQIRRIYTHASGVNIPAKLPAKVKRGKSAEVKITLDPAAVEAGSILNDTLIIITDDPVTPVSKLRLVGNFN